MTIIHSQGPFYPGTVTQGAGDQWTPLSNIQASDGSYASCSAEVDHTNNWCPTIYAKNFGFSIPSGATIVGILCEYKCKCNVCLSTTRKTYLIHAYAGKADGTYSTTDMADGDKWAITPTTISLGSSSDLWGETWTADNIDDADFGIAFTAYQLCIDTSATVISYLDFIRFTVYYTNPAPTAPTGLTMANFNATTVADFAWTFNDPMEGDTQSAYRLLIYKTSDSSLVYDSGKVASSISSLTLPADTLTNGYQYQWKVLTYDNEDQVSPYSALATFYCVSAPTGTITYPATNGATHTTASLTAQWSYSDPGSNTQSYYQLVLKNDLSEILEDSGKTAGSGTSYTFEYALEDDCSYSIELTVWNSKGIASSTATRTFIVDYPVPATPTFTVSSNKTRGSITLSITNPEPSGYQPDISYNSVYRKKSTESAYIRIATVIAENGTYTDYTPASGLTYDYKVRAIGDNQGYADSAVSSQSITIKNTQLALTSDYSQMVTLVYNVTRSDNRDYGKVMMDFAGRSESVAEFGKQIKAEIPLSFTIKDDAVLQSLIDLIETKGTLLYRDQRGRREFVTIGSFSIVDQFRPKMYIVSFTPQRTSYSEVV